MKIRLKKIWGMFLVLFFGISAVSINSNAAESKTGEFTVASMNVDGLPAKVLFVSINADGPGADGTKKISEAISSRGWDIIGVSEDFNYDAELMSSLTEYNSGTHRGKVSGLYNKTDGLNLIWKNTLNVTGENWVSWNEHYGEVTNGADGLIDKGYRYYQAEIEEGVNLDIYILHMDADSDAQDIAARESQLKQLVSAIKASNHGNPIIVMGDTNCRYTRENLKTLLIDEINADGRFTVQDTWVELVWNGVYPHHGADAMVATDKGGTYAYPHAEIVDKIFYINNVESDVTISAKSHTVATDFLDTDGTALADHWPVVVEFEYTINGETTPEIPEECVHNYQIENEIEASCVNEGLRTFKCTECGASYSETIQALGHTYLDGACTVCGETDPDYQPEEPIEPEIKLLLGEVTTQLEDGKKYVIAFSGTTGIFALEKNDSKEIVANKFKLTEGDEVNANQYWTLTKMDDGIIISSEIDGKVYYLYRTNTYVGYGYKVSVREDEPYVWKTVISNNKLRIYSQTAYGRKHYLRYYNSRVGWIASTGTAGVSVYQVNE